MSIYATMKQGIRATGNLDKYEFRASRYGAFDLFMRQMSDPNAIISAEMKEKFWNSIGHTFQVPVFQYDGDVAVSVGQARSLVVNDAENNTAMVTVTPVTYGFGFTMYPTLYHNNEFGYQADFQKKMIKHLNKLAGLLDSACVTSLSTNKTKVLANSLGYSFASSKLTSTFAKREHLLGSLDPMMASNDFYDQMYVLGDMGLYDLVQQLKQSGVYNAINKQNEYMNKTLMFSNRVVPASTDCIKGFAVNAGSVGILFRVDRESLYGTKSRTGREWSVETLPMLDIPVGHMYYESDVDASAVAGDASADMTASHKQHFGFSVDVAIVCSYNSADTTMASPIIEFGVTKEA